MVRVMVRLATGVAVALGCATSTHAQTQKARLVRLPDTLSRDLGWQAGNKSVSVSRDGHLIAYKDVARRAWVYDRARKAATNVAEGAAGGVELSPTGDAIAYVKGWNSPRRNPSQINVWVRPLDPKTGTPAGPERRLSLIPGSFPAFSPDGKRLAFVAQDGAHQLIIVPTPGGPEQRVNVPFDSVGPFALSASGEAVPDVRYVSWSADGNELYFGFHALWKVPVAGGAAKLVVDQAYPKLSTPGVSLDGRVIVTEDDDRRAGERGAEPPLFIIRDAAGKRLDSLPLPRGLYPRTWLSGSTLLVGCDSPCNSAELFALDLSAYAGRGSR